MNEQLLKMNGLSVEILDALSFESHLGIPLKKNLHYFDKDLLIAELDLNKDTLKKLQKVILELDKIKMISKYVTRENFLDAAKKVKANIVEFIFNYIKSNTHNYGNNRSR